MPRPRRPCRCRAGTNNKTSGSDGVYSGFPRPDPDGFFNRRNEYFAVPNAARLSGTADRFDRLLNHIVTEHNLDLHLGEKINDVFGTAIELRVALLAPEPFRLGDCYSLQTNLLQRLLHFVEFEWLDDGLDFFHRVLSPGSRVEESRPGNRSSVSRSRAKAA